MDNSFQYNWNVSSWQAINVVFIRQFKAKLILSRAERVYAQPPRELTIEAVSMIAVITIFIIFAVWGSLYTVFEILHRENTRRKKLNNDTNNDCRTRNLQLQGTKTNSLEKDWFEKSRLFFQCFCMIKNGKKLFETNSSKEDFECFHGIRVLSNFSIICFHVGMAYFPLISNMEEFKSFVSTSPLTKVYFNLMFGVDTFFVLSGFLNGYSFSKEYHKSNGKICWWQFYIKRFLRLTPAYIVVFGFYSTLLCYTGSGPVWPDYVTNPASKENWWRYILYINNFQSSSESSMLWCWHLAAEMQVFVVSPIFLISLIRWPSLGYCLATTTIFLSCLSSFAITKQHNFVDLFSKFPQYVDDLDTFTDKSCQYADKLHMMPHVRIISYLIGILLGHYFYVRNFKFARNNWITLCCGWLTTGILIWISFFVLFDREDSVFETALYNGVKYLFFSVGLSWIIFVCLSGQGGFINCFLSGKLFFPVAKLSYCAYLIHPIIIIRDYMAAQELEVFSTSSMILYALRVYFLTIIFSIPTTLLFEMPIINLFYFLTKKTKHFNVLISENSKYE